MNVIHMCQTKENALFISVNGFLCTLDGAVFVCLNTSVQYINYMEEVLPQIYSNSNTQGNSGPLSSAHEITHSKMSNTFIQCNKLHMPSNLSYIFMVCSGLNARLDHTTT